MRFFQLLARPFVAFVERYYPDPFVFVVLLSALTFLLSLVLADATPAVALSAWGDGLPSLLAFTAQICITLLTAHALAHTDRVQILLKRIGNVPDSAAGAYALVAFSAGIGSLIAWSLGLIVGATVAREVARQGAARGIRIHYPLLVASAYAGFVIWHMGYSSSAGLFVATAGHSLEAEIGIIPITETVFTLHNGLLALVSLAIICMVCPLMRPNDQDLIEIDPALLEEHAEQPEHAPAQRTFAQYLDAMRPLTLLLGAGLFCYIGWSFYARGFHLNLNLVNWSFLGAGLLLARSPSHYVRLINNASSTIGPVLIQYPFYAGILGMMQGTGPRRHHVRLVHRHCHPGNAQLLRVPVRRAGQPVHPLRRRPVGGARADIHRSGSKPGGRSLHHRAGHLLRRPVDQHDPAVLDHTPAGHRGPAHAPDHGLHLRDIPADPVPVRWGAVVVGGGVRLAGWGRG